jgi:hypothetical protein
MMQVEPQKEHQWLQQLVGDWTFESDCIMGPDAPPMKSTGSDHSHMLGELWALCEWEHQMPEGPAGKSLMTLGFDPDSKRFVGTFVSSMMTYMWTYDGELDPNGKVLTLNAEGPSFAGDGSMANYQDIIEITGPNERHMYSQALGPDGKWNRFMTMNIRRKG